MSFNIYISSHQFPDQDPADIEYVFKPPVHLQGDYEVACVGGKIVNSVPNVSEKYNNNVFRYSVDNGVTWTTVTLPEGTYQTTALETELQAVMVANNHYEEVGGVRVFPIDFMANIYLLRFQIRLEEDCKIDLSIGEFYKLLGFASPTILEGPGTFTAPNIALFSTGGEIFHVQLDCVKYGMLVDNGVGAGLFGVVRSIEGGALSAAVSLRDPSGDYPYFPVNSNVLTRFRIRVYDALGRLANFRQESTSFELRFRKIQS